MRNMPNVGDKCKVNKHIGLFTQGEIVEITHHLRNNIVTVKNGPNIHINHLDKIYDELQKGDLVEIIDNGGVEGAISIGDKGEIVGTWIEGFIVKLDKTGTNHNFYPHRFKKINKETKSTNGLCNCPITVIMSVGCQCEGK